MFEQFLALFLHLDTVLGATITQYGVWIYPLLGVVIFCETGLVIMPFLPGDSLLFVAGAFAARGDINIWLLLLLTSAVAILGDAVNYLIGKKLGVAVLRRGSLLGLPIKAEYVERTKGFFVCYGAKTLVIARFVPIVRTFAPFVAGLAVMPYGTFAKWNVLGALLWVNVCLWAGYFLGNFAAVQQHFSLVLFGIIGVSLLPGLVEWLRSRKAVITVV